MASEVWAVVVDRIDGGGQWENCRHEDRLIAEEHAAAIRRHLDGYCTATVVERETDHAGEADRLLRKADDEPTYEDAYLATMQAQARASLALAAAQDRYGVMVKAMIEVLGPQPEQPKPTCAAPALEDMSERILETGNEPTRLTARFVMLLCDRASVTSNPDDVTQAARIDVSEAALVLADWVLNEYDAWKTHNGSPWQPAAPDEVDVAHIMTEDGCKISVNGQGHFPCREHLPAAGEVNHAN